MIENYFYENGKISSITTTLNFKDIRHRYYYPNGNINFDINLLDGVYHGDFISYYPSGVISMEVNHKNGKQHGEWRDYYENGNLKSQMTYTEGNV